MKTAPGCTLVVIANGLFLKFILPFVISLENSTLNLDSVKIGQI